MSFWNDNQKNLFIYFSFFFYLSFVCLFVWNHIQKLESHLENVFIIFFFIFLGTTFSIRISIGCFTNQFSRSKL